jgi:hypothetical protein
LIEPFPQSSSVPFGALGFHGSECLLSP